MIGGIFKEFGGLLKFWFFYLSNNSLEGFILVLFVNCLILGVILFDNNKVINGFIFVEFGDMLIFGSFVVIDINFSGDILWFCNVNLLSVFVFNNNNFMGCVFVFFFLMCKFYYIVFLK